MRCGVCCLIFGVCVTPFDIIRIAKATGKKPIEFVGMMSGVAKVERGEPTVLIDNHPALIILRWGLGRMCPFYSEAGCVIYDDRPMVCRTYPFMVKKGKLIDTQSRACQVCWRPEDESGYRKDIKQHTKELKAYRKIADEWNKKGGSLEEFLAFALERAHPR